ncbi:hypothetical protein E2C01_010528 [Portunus trituberculatus]|uniref:Uncharacterized protein n=1 Tax=Portunus trituberculatus TaxID=210409 RepID=A0A5B7D8Q6_PORTR|nr:hypothetical protein [Portunus trituberculatus]
MFYNPPPHRDHLKIRHPRLSPLKIHSLLRSALFFIDIQKNNKTLLVHLQKHVPHHLPLLLLLLLLLLLHHH